MTHPTEHPMTRIPLMAPLIVAMALLVAAAPASADTVEDFSTMPLDTCITDGTFIGMWDFVFNGYGCTAFVSLSGNTVLMEQPKASTKKNETHAALVVGPDSIGDVTLRADLITTQQLRTGSSPKAWEVAWLLWNYADNQHFYYFIPKPTGWELGKEDPAYAGSQRFLASGTWPVFPIGQWYRVLVAQAGGTIQVSVNGVVIATFTDDQSPYTAGRVGLYTEDSESYFDNISVTSGATISTDTGGTGGGTGPGKGHKH